MKKILLPLSIIFAAGCSSFGETNKQETKDKMQENNVELFQALVENGNDTIVPIGNNSSNLNADFTTCLSFKDSNEVLELIDACESPLSSVEYNNKLGVLKQKNAVGSRTFTLSGEQLDFNIHEFVMEDGVVYQSVNIRENLPYEKASMLKVSSRLVKRIEYLREEKIIYNYGFNREGIMYILDKDSQTMKDLYHTTAESDKSYFEQATGDVIFNLNFVSEFIDEENTEEALRLLGDVSTTLINQNESGLLFTSVSDESIIDLQGTNTTFSGGSGDMSIALIIMNRDIENIEPTKIIINEKEILLNKMNYRSSSAASFVLIEKEHFLDLYVDIEKNETLSFIDNNNKQVKSALKLSNNDQKKLLDAIRLIDLIEYQK